jgi:hypothetical protein
MTSAERPLPAGPGDPAPAFNESQKRSLLFGLADLHQRLEQMETWLGADDPSPLSRYVNDLSPAEARVVRDSFARLRAVMQDCLRECDLPPARRTSLRWALQVGLSFLHVAVAEMGPGRLGGYGPLAPAGRAQALKVQQELSRLIEELDASLRRGPGGEPAGGTA